MGIRLQSWGEIESIFIMFINTRLSILSENQYECSVFPYMYMTYT